MQPRLPVKRSRTDLTETQKSRLDHDLKQMLSRDDLKKDCFDIMNLVYAGANVNILNGNLLSKLIHQAHIEYDRNEIADYAGRIKNIENYTYLCGQNSNHAFIINCIMRLIEIGADPNTRLRVSCELYPDGVFYYYLTPLTLALDYMPEKVSSLLEAGALPLTPNHPGPAIQNQWPYKGYSFNPFNAKCLISWLISTNTISDKIVNVLKEYKEDLNFISYVSSGNYLKFLNPLTPAGKIVWAQTGRSDCTLYNGTRKKIIDKLTTENKITQEKIIAKLYENGIVIDKKTGAWSLRMIAPEIITKDKLRSFTNDDESLSYIESFIKKSTCMDFNKYWNDEKTSLIHKATKHGWIQLVKKLIEFDKELLYATKPVSVYDLFDSPDRLLDTAARHGQYDVAVFLLENYLNNKDSKVPDGIADTPLHRAAYLGYTRLVSLFLKNGANIHVKDKEGHTPLEAIINSMFHFKETFDIIAKLIAYGADIPFYYKPNANTPTFLCQYFILKPLLRKAQDANPDNIVELTKALLNTYINPGLFTNHNQIIHAEALLKFINDAQGNFNAIQNKANEMLSEPYMAQSTTFKAICVIINQKEFEYFLKPVTNAVKQPEQFWGAFFGNAKTILNKQPTSQPETLQVFFNQL